MKNKKFTFQKGQTLMEILIYVAIFGIVAASLVGIVWNITKIHSYQLASNEVDSNLRYAMNLISDRIRGASSVESATGSTLVLKMPNNTTTTFNVIDGVLYIQEGSADPVAVISDRVVVSRDGLTDGLTFEKIDMARAKGGARVTLTLSYVPKEGGTTSLQRTLLSAVTRSATAISFSEDIVPGQNASYSVGSASYNWKNGYFSGDLTVDGTISGTTFCISSDCKTAWPSGGGGTLTGTGTINKVAKWTSSSALGDSLIYDNGTNVGIGTTSPGYKLDVNIGATANYPLELISSSKFIRIGALNASYAHFDTDATAGFYFYDNITTPGTVTATQFDGALTAGSVPWSLVTGRATPTFTDVYATSWLRNTAANTGLYNEATASHFYSSSAGVWNIAGGSTYPQLIFRDTHAGTIRGYVYSDVTGFGMLHSAGGWMFYSPTGNSNVYFPAWGNWISSAATHRGEGTNFIDYSYGLYDAYRGGWRASNDLYVAYAYNAGYAASAGTVSQACVFCLNGSPQCGSTWPNVTGLITGSAHTFYGWGVGCSGSLVAQSGQILLCCK